MSAVHERLREFEQDWHDGKVAQVLSQYDPSLIMILGGDFLGYTETVERIKKMLLTHAIPQLQLDVITVRDLGRTYTLANGRVHSTWSDGHEQTSPFTVIYACKGGWWKLIYSQS